MDLRARRVFRLSLTTALTLVAAYSLELKFAFLAPLFGFVLTIKPAAPMSLKALISVVVIVALTTSTGLLLVPLLMNYPSTAILVVTLGIFFSFYLTVHLKQASLGLFIAVGFTIISAAGLYDFMLGERLVESMISSIIIAIVCQWLVYPLFPEDPAPAVRAEPAQEDAVDSKWISIRGTLIVLPVYLLALHNPSMFIAAIMKAVSLGQQSSQLQAREAGRELLGSTFLAGLLAIGIWLGLSILPHLWMYFLLMLLAGIYVGSKVYGILPSRYAVSFWQNAMITMLILLGPAIEDLSTGKDVYKAFFVRFCLFVFISVYTWWTLMVLDEWRHRKNRQTLKTKEKAL